MAPEKKGDGEGFSPEEKAAMKERAAETKAAKARGKGKQADGEADVKAKIAEMEPGDRELAQALHALVAEVAPGLAPRTWYGMPAYAKDGKVLMFFQASAKFSTRYCTLGFSDTATLDDGAMWPTAYALTTMDEPTTQRIRELLERAGAA